MNEHAYQASHSSDIQYAGHLCVPKTAPSRYRSIGSSLGSAAALVGGVAGMPLLRKLHMRCAVGGSDGLVAALPKLTALTSLDLEGIHILLSQPTSPALLRAISALPSLQHLGLPHQYSITQCADALSGLTGLQSLRLISMTDSEEPRAAQLLSWLTRIELDNWSGSRTIQPVLPGLARNRSAWLAQLKQVAVGQVHLLVLAALPPGVCITPRSNRAALTITCQSIGAGAVRAAVSRWLDSAAVKDGESVLDFTGLQPWHSSYLLRLCHVWVWSHPRSCQVCLGGTCKTWRWM